MEKNTAITTTQEHELLVSRKDILKMLRAVSWRAILETADPAAKDIPDSADISIVIPYSGNFSNGERVTSENDDETMVSVKWNETRTLSVG